MADQVKQVWFEAMPDNNGLANVAMQSKQIWDNMLKDAEKAGLGMNTIWQNTQTSVHNAALDGFRSFEQEYLRLYEEFQTKRAEAVKAGADNEGLVLADFNFDESIKQLATDFAENTPAFKKWAEGISQIVKGATEDGSRQILEDAIFKLERVLALTEIETYKLLADGSAKGDGEAMGMAYAQIEALKTEIETLRSAGSPGKAAEKWQKLSPVLQNIGKDFNELGGAIGGTAGEAIKTAGTVALSVMSVIDSIFKFSDTASKSIDTTASASAQAVQKAERASAILAVISAAIKAVKAIAGVFKANEDAAKAAAEAHKKYAKSLHDIEIKTRYKKHENIFGTDDIGKFGEAVDVANDALKAMNKTASGLDNSTLEAFKRNAIELTKQLDDGAISIDEFRNRADGIEADFRSKWQKFWGTGDKNIHAFNINDFWDGETLNTEALQAWYDANKEGLDAYEKTTLEGLLAAGNEYTAAVAIQTEYIKQLWSDLAGSIADNMIEAFLETGDAAANLDDVVDNVVKNMAKSMIESLLITGDPDLGIKGIFNDDLKSRLLELLKAGDQVGANNLIKGAIESTGQLAPVIEGIIESVGLVAGGAEDAANASRTSASQGIAQASQDSIDGLTGLITNIENHTYTIAEILKAGTPGFSTGNTSNTWANLEVPVINIADMMKQNQATMQANMSALLADTSAIRTNTNRLEAVENHLFAANRRLTDISDGITQLNRG